MFVYLLREMSLAPTNLGVFASRKVAVKSLELSFPDYEITKSGRNRITMMPKGYSSTLFHKVFDIGKKKVRTKSKKF